MAFKTDKQTLNDLGIFAGSGSESIYTTYNACRTQGGLNILENMFRNPLTDKKILAARTAMIKFFQDNTMVYPYDTENFAPAELYIQNTDKRSQLAAGDKTLRRRMSGIIGSDAEFTQIHQGVVSLISIIADTNKLLDNISTLKGANLILDLFDDLPNDIKDIVSKYSGQKRISYDNCVEIDNIFRFKLHQEVVKLLNAIYYIDVYYSVAEVAVKRGFVFAKVVDDRDNYIMMKGVYHPRLIGGIGNDITIDEKRNILFLTGANMAGKSTIMKSISIALYVAHVGFPVAAKEMAFTVRSGMYTTINLPDNINAGYSHFYSEVMRLKKVAQEVRQDNNLFIIFDELFRGTNVKDAYDATVAVIMEFSNIRRCTFIVSTHIIEAGEELAGKCENIQFIYMPTVMENGVPRYTYVAREGVTEDRHGMVIINNEKIIEIIENAFLGATN